MTPLFKKILFVNPGRNAMFATNEPLNLAFLASFVRSLGVEVMIADELSGEDIDEKVRRFKPDIAGITATSPLIRGAYAAAAYFRERKIPTILGGVHASTLPDDAKGKVDCVVVGEGEYPLRKILLEGLGNAIAQPENNPVDIAAMPLPAYDLLNTGYYLNVRRKFPQDGNFLFVPGSEKVLSVMITRGCPWNCAFCHNMWRGLPFRIYPPEKVVELLVYLRSSYNLGYFIFRDDNIFSVRSRIIPVLSAMADAGLGMKWGANARVDCLDEEVVALARKAGCQKLNFGFESGSQRMLDLLNKRTTTEKIRETVRLCQRQKVQVSGSFIVGQPGETREDIQASHTMIRELKLDSMGVAIATPFPGTEWWRLAAKRGLIGERIEWEKFDFDNVPILLNESFTVKELKKIQRRYYWDAFRANPRYLAKMAAAVFSNPATMMKRIANVLGRG